MIGDRSSQAVPVDAQAVAVTTSAPPHLRRSRLHAALARPARQRITAIYAPAGSGKTELVLDWIEKLGAARSAVYVDLTAGAAARWWRAPLRAPSWWPSWAVNVAALGQALHDGIPAQVAGSVIVVLDGTEAVDGAGFLAQVRQLAAGEERLHIVLLGRHAPPDDSFQRPERSSTNGLSWRELAFTAAETAALCAHRGLDLPAAVSRRLYAVTGGWAAGLMVGTAALCGAPHEPEGVLEQLLRTGAGLSEYILRDVLSRHPADLHHAVRDSCVVESVCPDLFDAVTGRTDGADVLTALARDDMFAVRLDDTSVWYRYRRLWRSALYTALTEDDPTHARRLHGAAAEWYATHHQPAEALRHALAGADRTLAVRLAYLHRDAIRETLPQSVVTAPMPRPWSSLSDDEPLAHAFAVHRGVSDDTPRRRPPSNRQRRAATNTARSESLRPDASPPTIRPDTTQPVDPIQNVGLPIWRALRRGDIMAAQAALTVSTPAAGSSPLHRSTALRLHAVIARMTGQLDSAVRHAETLGRTVRADGLVGSHDDGWGRLVLAEVAVQRGEHNTAVQHLDALAVHLWQSVPTLVAGQHLQSALLLQQQHDYAAALDTVQRLITDGDDGLLVPRWAARVLRVELLIATDRLPDAQRHWRLDATTVPAPTAAITTAKLALAQRSPARIDGLLRPALHTPGTSLFHQIEARLLMAQQTHTTGATERAMELLQQAVGFADQEQIQHPFHANRHLLAATLDQLSTPPTTPTTSTPVAGTADIPADPLSPGEAAVLRQLTSDHTIREIAAELHLSRNTVKTHIASIYRKLAVHTRSDAIHTPPRPHYAVNGQCSGRRPG